MEQDEQIRMLVETGIAKKNIAETFGVSLEDIDRIVSGENKQQDKLASKKAPSNAYTKEEFEEAKRLRAEGKTNIAIAMAQNRSASFVGKALQCETYEDLLEMRKRDTERKREHYENKAAQKQNNADRRRKRQRNYEAAKRETKKLEKTIAQAAIVNPDTLAEISKQLARIADALEAMPKKRSFFRH